MSEQYRGAVVGNALLSFFSDVDQGTRERLQMALLFTQRVTDEALSNGWVTDHYDYFRRQLMFLGWDGRAPRASWEPDLERRRTLEQRLARIGATAGAPFSEVTRWSIDALEGDGRARLHFEQRSLARESFQLVPCRASEPGYVDLVLYHEVLEQEARCSGFLLGERIITGSRAELVRFNVRQFDRQFSARVGESLAQVLSREVYSLQDAM